MPCLPMLTDFDHKSKGLLADGVPQKVQAVGISRQLAQVVEQAPDTAVEGQQGQVGIMLIQSSPQKLLAIS